LREDELRQFVISDAEAKSAGEEAIEAITHYEVIKEFKLNGGKEVTFVETDTGNITTGSAKLQ